MNQIIVRKATIDDLELLLKWRMEVITNVFPKYKLCDGWQEILLRSNREYYKAQLTKDGHVACIATVDGNPVGCGGLCLYSEMPSPDNINGRCAYLMNIYVREPQRCRGIGTEITRWLLNEAFERDADKIYLETTPEARPMYASLGFSEMDDMMVYRKKKTA